MRNIFLGLLLAGTAITPAMAQRHRDDAPRPERNVDRSQSHEDRSQARQERSQQREEARPQRAERVERVQRVERQSDAGVWGRQRSGEVKRVPVEVQQQQQVQQIEQAQRLQRERSRPGGDARRQNVNERGRPTLGDQGGEADRASAWQQRRRGAEATQADNQQRQARRDRDAGDIGRSTFERQIVRNGIRVPEGARPDRPAPMPETALHRDRRDRDHRWRTDWRNDHRYDWRKHRRNHRSTFHLGVYFDPFGWGYHRYNIGWRLWPSYYSSNYWLNDPYMYRLPYAPWPFKWVRYYDDALLVNTITGQVADVIYDFFW
jgi:Ni/Co efflux regulator RcnB